MKNVVLVIAVLAAAAFVYFNFFKKEAPATDRIQRMLEQARIQGKSKYVPSQPLDKVIGPYGAPIKSTMIVEPAPAMFAFANDGIGAESTFQTCFHHLVSDLGLPANWAWEYCSNNPGQVFVGSGNGQWNFNNVGAATPVLNPNNLINLNNYQS